MGVPLLCVTLIFLYVGYQKARDQTITYLTKELVERTARQAAELNLYFGKMSRYGDSIATTIKATGPLDAKAYTILLDSVLDYGNINSAIIAFDSEAFLFEPVPPSPLALRKADHRTHRFFSQTTDYDYTFADWFQLPKLSGTGMWTDPLFSTLQEDMICAYGTPIYKGRFFQGVVALAVPVTDIISNLESINLQGSQLILLSQFGTIVVHPNPDFILRHTFISLASEQDSPELLDFAYQMRKMSVADVVRFDKGILGTNEYIAHARIPHTNWTLLSVIPESVVLAPLMNTLWRSILFVLVGSALVFILGYLFSAREIVKPLLQLENAARRLAEGNLDTHVPENATTLEIRSLESTFNTMVSQLGASIGKEIEARLARSYAEDASKAKSEFVARMSHEIRTPMNAILGLAHLALHEKPEEKQRTFLLKIQRAGKSMLALINDILDFSKIEAGMLKLEILPFSLREVARTLEDLFQTAAAEKGISFQICIDDDVPDQLIGDSLRLTQILMNLCNNALKFTQQGSITVHMSSSELSEIVCALAVSVTDTGIGIPQEAQTQLFNEFTQADSSITRKFGGTGLGLAICKLLAELMRGEVVLQSSSDAGSTFTVTIPFNRAQEESASLLSAAPAENTAYDIPADTRILIAEDNDINQEIIKALLEYKGLSCRMANNGKEAVQALAEESFDIVLMDIQMPVMDGFAATLALRAQGFTMPILAMTANALDTDKEACHAGGMDAHIAKPIDPAELYEKMAFWLKEKGRGREEA